MQKKIDWLKISPLVKIPQLLSNQADIQAILPTHELIILTKFPQWTGSKSSKRKMCKQ